MWSTYTFINWYIFWQFSQFSIIAFLCHFGDVRACLGGCVQLSCVAFNIAFLIRSIWNLVCWFMALKCRFLSILVEIKVQNGRRWPYCKNLVALHFKSQFSKFCFHSVCICSKSKVTVSFRFWTQSNQKWLFCRLPKFGNYRFSWRKKLSHKR